MATWAIKPSVLRGFVNIATLGYTLTKLGKILDDRQNRQSRKADPSLDAEGLADAPAMQSATPETDDVPVWLREPVPAPSGGGGAFAAFKRAAIFWGASVAALVVVFAGAMWLFDEHGSDQPLALESTAPPRTPTPAPAPVVRTSALPPLVLLAPAPDPAAKTGVPAAVAALPAPQSPLQALKTPAKAAPLAAQLVPKAPAAKPVLAKAAPKAAPKVPAQLPRKVALAKNTPVQTKAKPAAANKPVVVAKHAPAPAPGKAKPRLLAAVALPPARARSAERETQRAAPAKTYKCYPGELARECEARH